MQYSNTPIEVHDLTVSYQGKPVLYGIDLEIPEGSIVGILGPNGAGKTTLIKSIMNMIKPNSGYIRIFGQNLALALSKSVHVPQRESIDWDFPVSVMDVVLMGRYGHLGWIQMPGKADRQIASECLERVNMLNYSNRQIGNLSGGQQQRVLRPEHLHRKAQFT